MADATYSDEIWTSVVGYEGIYEVSDRGRVRSLDRVSTQIRNGKSCEVRFRGRYLHAFFDKDGYPQVKLCGAGRAKSESIHRIVCRAFHGPKPSEDYEVAHNDGCKTNSAASNLRWATKAENQADREAHGTIYQGEAAPNARLTEQQAREIRKRSNAGEWSSLLAKEYGINKRYVREIATGTKWKSIGAGDGEEDL